MDGDPWQPGEYVPFKNYDPEDFQSGPTRSHPSSFSLDGITMHHSFGYDCSRRNNLDALDENTLVFTSGNFLHFLNPKEGSVMCQPSALGSGISCLAVHPRESFFAVAEKGQWPPVLIYSWPQRQVISVLRRITASHYDCMAFSVCGRYLAVQGGYPDLTFSLWNWREEVEMARSHAHRARNYQIQFSEVDFRQITVCGDEHLTFWTLDNGSGNPENEVMSMEWDSKVENTSLELEKMPCARNRFLQDQGSFMQMEATPIESIIVNGTLGKVVSSTNWGSLLLWKDRLVQTEIIKKDGKPCHEGPINHLLTGEGELMTIGSDGWIRVWDLDSIYEADLNEDDESASESVGTYRLDPMYEIRVGFEADLQSIVKNRSDDEDEEFWFVQDGNGHIWKADLLYSLAMEMPSTIYQSHAAQVQTLHASPHSDLLFSGGSDGQCCLFDLNRKTMVASVKFMAGVSSLLWLSPELDPSGKQLLAGFEDGAIRLFLMQTVENQHGRNLYGTRDFPISLELLVARKPHSQRVSKICSSQHHPILATLGAEGRVFFFRYHKTSNNQMELVPIKFIGMEDVPIHFEWSNEASQAYRALLVLKNGSIWSLTGDEHQFSTPQEVDVTSFLDSQLVCLQIHKIESAEKSEEAESSLLPTSIIHAQTLRNNFLLIFSQNSQYRQELHIYQCEANDSATPSYQLEELKRISIPTRPKGRSLPTTDARTALVTAVSVWLGDNYLFLGYDDGVFRAHRLVLDPNPGTGVDPEAWTLDDFWTIPLFEPTNGQIRSICPLGLPNSHLLAVCANDGGLMTLRLGAEFNKVIEGMRAVKKKKMSGARRSQGKLRVSEAEPNEEVSIPNLVQDLDDPKYLSLEEERRQLFQEKRQKSMTQKKICIQRNLANLKIRFQALQARNDDLPLAFRFPKRYFQLTNFTFAEMEAENQARLGEIRQNAEIEQKLYQEGLQLIQKAFYDDVIQPRRTVKGIREDTLELNTFRVVRDDNIVLEVDLLARLHPRSARRLDSRSSTLSTEDYQPSSASSSSTSEDESDDSLEDEPAQWSSELLCSSSPGQLMASMNALATLRQPLDRKLLDGRVLKALERQEERQNKTKARLKQWEELLARKPSEDPDDCDQVQEMDEDLPPATSAQRTDRGQFIRKTSELFESGEPIKEDAQRRKIIQVLMQIREIKGSFNVKVGKIKERKSSLIQEFRNLREELIEIQEKLPPPKRKHPPDEPTLKEEEMEKDPFEIDQALLSSTKAKLVEDEQMQILEGAMASEGLTSAFSASAPSVKRGSKARLERRVSILSARSGIGAIPSANSLVKTTIVDKCSIEEEASNIGKKLQALPHEEEVDWNVSELEQQVQYLQEQRLIYRQDQILTKLNELIDKFDQDMDALIYERKEIHVQLKFAEISAICMYEELQIIIGTEKQENELIADVDKNLQGLSLYSAKIRAKEQELDQSKLTLDKFVDHLKHIHEKLTYELADNRHGEHLTKLFHFKAKGLKLPKDKDERYLCPNANEEVQTVKSDLFREESIAEDQTHPPNLDQNALTFVLDMRRRRDLVESAIRTQEKTLKKAETGLLRLKTRLSHKNVEYAEAKSRLHTFRVKKQRKINHLEIVVGLKKRQLVLPQEMYDQATSNQGFEVRTSHSGNPEGNNALLVFPWQHWQQLQAKTEELKSERINFQKKFKEDRQEFLNLQEECKSLRNQIQARDEKCSSEMAKRFGAGITMDDIDNFSINRTLEEMRESSKRKEEHMYRDIEDRQTQIKRDKQALTETIRNNTKLVEKKTQLLQARTELERLKVSNEETLAKERIKETKEAEDRREFENLMRLYQSQQCELGEMHQKLAQFMTKGVHVARCPLSTPPNKVTQRKIIATAKVKLNGRELGQRDSSLEDEEDQDEKDHDLLEPNLERALNQGRSTSPSPISIVVEKVE